MRCRGRRTCLGLEGTLAVLIPGTLEDPPLQTPRVMYNMQIRHYPDPSTVTPGCCQLYLSPWELKGCQMLCNGKLSDQDRLMSFGCAKYQGMSRRRERLSLHSTQASIASENRVAHMRQGAHVVSSGLSKCSDAGMVLRMPCSVRGDPWRLLSRDPPMPDPVRSTLSCRAQTQTQRRRCTTRAVQGCSPPCRHPHSQQLGRRPPDRPPLPNSLHAV